MASLLNFFDKLHEDNSDEEAQVETKPTKPTKPTKKYYGTVVPYPNFSASNDARVLQSAIECKGVDEEVIISVLVRRTNEQRQMIKTVYEAQDGKSLEEDLKSALKYDLEDVALALLMRPAFLDAYYIRKATKRLGTDEEVLIEIMASRTNQQIRDLAKAFKEAYDEELEEVIKHETEGNFAKTLLTLLRAERDESEGVNRNKAREDAKKLAKALEDEIDYDTLIDILTSRSWKQVDETIKLFPSVGEDTFGKTLEKQLRGDIEDCLVQLAKCAWNLPAYFAEKVHGAMERHGTCENTLIRVIVGRSELDLKKILQQYKLLYGRNVQDDILEDTRGHHETILLGLCGPV